MDRIALSAQPLDVRELEAVLDGSQHGARLTFVGLTRETSPDDPRPVAALEYEAYEPMALAEMTAIADEARAKFGPLHIALVHRVGRVEVGEASVAVVVAAPHRAGAFDACRYAIDELKARVSVWKREVYRDGDSAWITNAPPHESAT
jgi:molybdopterin synthase catalytic subunit